MLYTIILRNDSGQEKKFTKTFVDSKQRVQYIINKRKIWDRVILLEEGVELKDRVKEKNRGKYDTKLEADIVAKSRKVPTLSCIYALIHNEKVVYIGQSTNPGSRLGAHLKSKKQFDSWAIVEWVDASKKYLDKREQEYIKALKPKYNITHNV